MAKKHSDIVIVDFNEGMSVQISFKFQKLGKFI